MKNTFLWGLLALSFLIVGCKEKVSPETTDNIFHFSKYISSHTQGLQSIAQPIRIRLTEAPEQYELNQELPDDLVVLKPKVAGKVYLQNGNELIFEPDGTLRPDTEYFVTVHLNRILNGIDPEFDTYTFGFKTIAPGFKIDILHLQSHNREWQYLTGILEASDIMPEGSLQNVISATAREKDLHVNWEETDGQSRYFRFRIDSIPRINNDYKLLIQWDGNPVGVDLQGESEVEIKGLDHFDIVSIKTQAAPNALISVNFSEPLDESQNLDGLIRLGNQTNLRFEILGNLLNIYPSSEFVGSTTLNIYPGIRSSYATVLNEGIEREISFEALKPAVRLISKGTILPDAETTPIYFETASLNAVEVRVIQVFTDNMLQYLQYNELGGGYYADFRPVGRRVAYKLIDLRDEVREQPGQWKAHALDLSDLIVPDPGSLYRVEISFKPEYRAYACGGELQTDTLLEAALQNPDPESEYREESYWDNQVYSWRDFDYTWDQRDNPCHPAYYNTDRFASTNVLGSDIGLIVKKGENGSYRCVVTNLLTAQPEAASQIKYYNYQQQLLSTLTTDVEGTAIFDADQNVAFVIAQKGRHYAYARLMDGNSNSLSMFQIDGSRAQNGLQGFIYTDRGVHRPGDPVHLTFVLNDKANPIPEDHPVILEVSDARGKLVQRTVINKDTENRPGLHPRKGGKFYYFPIETRSEAPTGTWNAKIIVGGAIFSKPLRIATVKPNRLKINLDFEDDLLNINRPVEGKLSAGWLHGAVGRNLNFDISTTLSLNNRGFESYPGYIFQDPVRSFTIQEQPWIKGSLAGNGTFDINKSIAVDQKAPGLLKATFTTKVYEQGGDFSIDVFNKDLAPYPHLVGLRTPEPERYGSFLTDQQNRFEVVSVDSDGTVAPERNLQVMVYKIEWRWWWNRDRGNLSRYENTSMHRPFMETRVTTDSKGQGHFTVNIPDDDGGRYLIRVIDEKSGHATGTIAYFYRNWWKQPGEAGTESAKMLLFSADKTDYAIGETAMIRFPSSAGGKALLSIENASEVLKTLWVDTKDGETMVELPLTEEMTPNIYIHISLLQPHGRVANDLPIRLYGVIPILVNNPATDLEPELRFPEVIQPETEYSLRVNEANGRAMTYSIAVVDEGLLDLTRFETPDIHTFFYDKQALGVKTFDNFDDVMGAYSISLGNIYAIGGGDVAAGAQNRKAQRFKPVVSYLGPFHLKAGEQREHKLDMPNYIGSVRAMVVAGDGDLAYGRAEATAAVRKPLMILASVPRKLSPGEMVQIPVTVFAMDSKVKNPRVTLKTSDALKPIGNTTVNLNFKEPGEQLVQFEVEVLSGTSPQSIQVIANGNGETSTYEVELDVENPNPISRKHQSLQLGGKESKSLTFTTFGTEGTNAAAIELSTLPPMDLERRLDYLIRYPHGCVEQTVSSAFPQLYLTDILDLNTDQQESLQKHVRSAIQKLSDFQIPNGGLSYWPGGMRANDWGSVYAGHFMIEAKNKGYALPLTFLANWLSFQKKAAIEWGSSMSYYNSDLLQAYRLYTLALAGEADLSSMNRLRNSGKLGNAARWRLAAAYAILGKKEVARELANSAGLVFSNETLNRYTYGSAFRNEAMALETLVLLEDEKQQELARSMGMRLSSDRWYSTQETAFGLMALSKMVEVNGGKDLNLIIEQDGTTTIVKTDKSLAVRPITPTEGANTLQIRNQGDNQVFVTLTQKGKLPVGKELQESKNLRLQLRYSDTAGDPLDIVQLRQGTEFTSHLTVYNSSSNTVENIALMQYIPSGWEIVNTSYTDLADPNATESDYTDIRDSKVNFYFDLKGGQSKTFVLKLNASFLGDYYLPGAQAEAMYSSEYFARNKGEWVKVIE